MLGNLPNIAARSAVLRQGSAAGQVVTVNVTPDKKMTAPVREARRTCSA